MKTVNIGEKGFIQYGFSTRKYKVTRIFDTQHLTWVEFKHYILFGLMWFKFKLTLAEFLERRNVNYNEYTEINGT